jgi:hypothetical protein
MSADRPPSRADRGPQSLRDLDAALAAGAGPASELLVERAILHLKADIEGSK